jgi:cobaltochelatase CobN
MRKQVILLVTTFVFALMLCGSVAAENTTINDFEENTNLTATIDSLNSHNNQPNIESVNTNSSNSSVQIGQSGLVDPKVLIIHSTTSTLMADVAAKNVMSTINPSQSGYNPDDPSTWLVHFDVRNRDQIASMTSNELKALIGNADIVICEWLFDPALSNFRTVINENPNIIKNKPNKIFLILNSEDSELTKLSHINGVSVFNGIPDSVIGTVNTDGTILHAVNNGNVQELEDYKATYPQLTDWLNVAIYYVRNGPLTYENQYKYVLKEYTTLNGGSWPVEWNPGSYNIELPKEMLYRLDENGKGEIFTSLASYLEKYPLNPSKPTVGLIERDSNLWSGNMQHFEYITNQFIANGFNVLPIIAAYSGTTGSPAMPLNMYSAMVKFFVYDPTKDTKSTANYVVNTTQYEANPSSYSYRIDSLVSFLFFTVGSGYLDQTNTLFEKMNVPIFRAVTSTKNSEGEWIVSDDGLLWSDTYYQIAQPETQGIVEPIFVATTNKQLDNITGAELISFHAIPERVDKLVNRVSNWAKLKYMDNANKKIALIYYNYPPGKQDIGASYLNSPESILNILNLLKQQGYTVTDIPKTSDELVAMMIRNGINVANWAPGVLEEMANDPNTILWDADEYEAWFNTLDPVAQKQVVEGPVGYIEEITKIGKNYSKTDDSAKAATLKNIDKWTQEMISLVNTYPDKAQQAVNLVNQMSNSLKDVINNINPDAAWNSFYLAKNAFLALAIPGLTGWGSAPGNTMTVTRNGKKYIVIPGLKFGNIFIGPEPQRGWEADAEKLYHSTIVPPPHCYLAWYAYVNTVLNVNAQVHVGRHATYEWLPSKSLALSSFDYPDIAIGDKPSIYLYVMDGVGEGLTSKRRGLAVIIDHLTPPLTTTSMDYGVFGDLKEAIDNYQKTPVGNPIKDSYLEEIKEYVKQLNLATDLQISNVDNMTEEDVDKVADYLMELEHTLMPYGLHTFGGSWSNEEIALLATSMVSSDSGSSDPSLQRLLAIKNGWDFDNLTLSQAEQLNDEAQQWILWIITGQKTVAQLTSNTQLQDKLNDAVYYASLINGSFSAELNALIDALNGGYITPSTGNDPVRSPGSLPTGKNFYSIDESQIPTKTAWSLGKKLADMALAQMDSIPEKIAAVIWSLETARDDGTMISFVLRMMGLEQTFNKKSGKPDKIVATPLSTLLADLNAVRAVNGLSALTERPRIDVIITTTGLFRDLFPRLLINLDRANRVALAASYKTIVAQYPSLQSALDYAIQTLQDAGYWAEGEQTSYKGNDPLDQNYIAKHWVELVTHYISQGISPNEAGEMAITRIFAPPVGDYGSGVNHAVEQSWTWDTRDDVADLYINRMGHTYTERNWGMSNPDLFKELLKGVDTAYNSRSTNLYGVLDNDDFFGYLGGLSMAIEKMNNGKAPNLYVVYEANPANPQIIALQTFMTREMRTRYFNPEWIQAMMNEGYSGARYISNKFVSYLWGWQVTSPATVENWMWDEVVNTYIKDQYNIGVDEWLSSGNNAYSMTSITGTLLTAAYNGYWQTDQATLRMVANTWAKMIIENGVACCDCSCGNIAMMEWVTQYINPDLLAQVKSQIYTATGYEGFAPSTPVNPNQPVQPTQPGQPSEPGQPSQPGEPGQPGEPSQPGQSEESASSNAGSTPGELQVSAATTPGDEGSQSSQAHEINPVNQQSSSQNTGMPIVATLAVIALVCLLAVGYFYRGRKQI